MIEKIDAAYTVFEQLLLEIKEYEHTIFTEEDTRVKIVDRILTEVLGYDYANIQTEPPAGGGYIDYKIIVNEIPKLIIEAKRDGIDFKIDTNYCGRAFKLNGPVFSDKVLQDGLRQAVYYSAIKGVELSCLTNGRTWIFFRSNRLGDGRDIFEGKGYLFGSLDCIKTDFKLFYELLSPENIEVLKFRALFQVVEGLEIRAKDTFKALKDENSLWLLDKGQYSYDIDRVMNEFFSKLSGDSDPDLLLECFVETKESKTAETQLSRISEDLVSKVRMLDTHEGQLLQDLIDRVKTTNRHEFVVIVGGKGAGKSTFIDRFFNTILTPELQEACLLIRLNVGESNGDLNTIVEWLNQNLLEGCENVVYGGSPTYDEIIGIFFNEYKRLSEGNWRGIYDSNKEQFKIDFGKHIETRRETKPHEYIKRLIGDITKSRKKVPCIVFDNTDHFGIDFQEKVFQYARSIYEKEVCLIIVPITDKTSWELSKQGAIQSFENETLFLPTPLPKKIIEKRIEYLQKKLNSNDQTKVQYFMGRGIKLEISNIEYFVKCLQRIFLKDDIVSKWIGNFANLDIRRCLDLTREMMASPHLSIDDLFKTYFAGNKEDLPIDPYKIRSALVKKLYTSYPVGHHSFIQNLYYCINDLNTSPILSIRVLQLLLDKKNDRTQDDAFMMVNQVLDYFSNMGFERSVILKHLDFLLKKGLIYSYDPTITDINNSKRIEISPSGHEHYIWGFYDNDYLFMMIEVTPVADSELFYFLQNSYYGWNKGSEVLLAFIEYLEVEDRFFCTIPDHPSYKGQVQILGRLNWRKERLKRFLRR